MLLRDRLRARLAEMGDTPDYPRLAAEVLRVRNAPVDLARRLVAQALVLEDRRDAWEQIGARLCAAAPASPGVYVLKDEAGRAVYVGKAVNLRRRLRAHFARGNWAGLKPGLARVADGEWRLVGSELEALLLEAALIRELQPGVNVQVGAPAINTRRLPRALVRDVIVLVPSVADGAVELIAARADGAWLMQRTLRSGADLIAHTARLMRFFHSPIVRDPPSGAGEAAIVFSWLAGRGAEATRLDPHGVTSARELRARLAALVADERLFRERLDQRRSLAPRSRRPPR